MRLEARDLKAGYGDTFAVEAAGLVIQERMVTGLIGPNGAGKSTLLKVLSRTMKAERGVVLLDGEAIHKLPSRLVARKLAFVGHNLDGLLELSVDELVQRGRYPSDGLQRVRGGPRIRGVGAGRAPGAAASPDPQEPFAWGAASRLDNDGPAQRRTSCCEPTTFLDIARVVELLALLATWTWRHRLMSMHDLLLTSLYCQRVIVVHEAHSCARPTEMCSPRPCPRDLWGGGDIGRTPQWAPAWCRS
jgi:iron complex transport system ATP-binding protein